MFNAEVQQFGYALSKAIDDYIESQVDERVFMEAK